MKPDRQTYEALLRPTLDGLYRFAHRLTGDTSRAEDLLQQAVLRGLERFETLENHQAFRGWQSQILYRVFLNQCGRKQAVVLSDDMPKGSVLSLSRYTDSADYALGRQELGKRLNDALEGLPEEQRLAVWLVDAQGYRYGEASLILGAPAGTVASRVARGRIVLRAVLKGVAQDRGCCNDEM